MTAMRSISFLLFLIGAAASAQDWTLLNPAFKYNFSDDGSDTISNQVFVADITLLGVDSFRYELNKVGAWCASCPGQGGGWLVNQPQFMGLRATVTSTSWVLEWADREVSIYPQVGTGGSWSYDMDQSITATVTNISEELVFGVVDSVKVISLSDGGTIRIAKAHGLLEMPGPDDGPFLAIGIQELGLGSVIPAADAFFALMPGDVVQYHTELFEQTNGSTEITEYETKYTITDRSMSADTLVLGYSAIRSGQTSTSSGGQGPQYTYMNDLFVGEWRVPSTDYGALGLISSYPGEVIHFAPHFYMYPDTLFCVAEHGIDADGKYVVRARKGNEYIVFGTLFSGSGDGPYGGTYFTYATMQAAEYRTGPGLQKLRYGQSSSGSAMTQRSYHELTGSVIGGDTIGVVHSDIFLGVSSDVPGTMFRLGPQPTNDRLVLNTDAGLSGDFSILDLEGRLIRIGRLTGTTRQEINVATLSEGMYVLVVTGDTGRTAQRFIIAR